jgi:hypothetical protein
VPEPQEVPKRFEGKIFCIGFQKTGTSTTREALRILGYRVHSACYPLIDPIRRGDLGPVHDVVARYDAFEDNPWPLLFRELDRDYPGSRFIMTIRDEAPWLRSVVNHLGVLPDRMQKLVYGHGAPGGYEDVVLARYRRHNEEVFAHFADRPDDILVIDYAKGDGWAEICGFLGCPVPTEPLPHTNARTYGTWTSRAKFAAATAVRGLRRLFGDPPDETIRPEPSRIGSPRGIHRSDTGSPAAGR